MGHVQPARHDCAVDPQAPRRHHGRTAVGRLDDDRRPRPRRRPAGDQRLPRACPRSRCSAHCSAAGTSSATRPNSSSSSRLIWRGRWRATSWPSRTTISTPPSDGAGMFLGRVNRVYGTMQTDLAQRPLSRRRRLHLQMSGDRSMSTAAFKTSNGHAASIARRALDRPARYRSWRSRSCAAGGLRIPSGTASRSARFRTTIAPTIRS